MRYAAQYAGHRSLFHYSNLHLCMSFVSYDNIQIGQSCDFWRAYGLFVARVESFVCKPDKSHLIISPSFD